ncbi:MAG: hypothetical protein IJL48_06895 [Bacteroidales bacterium]|nr:hypothetical protein [Bacteroidales bacterium]
MACAIILLHAMVPHHHHDCEGMAGLVFETEMACHCDCDHHDCDHHHSHHPFNTCGLQDMLSHLVIAPYDETSLVAYIQAEVHDCFVMAVPPVLIDLPGLDYATGSVLWHHGAVPLVGAPVLGANALRAPPLA